MTRCSGVRSMVVSPLHPARNADGICLTFSRPVRSIDSRVVFPRRKEAGRVVMLLLLQWAWWLRLRSKEGWMRPLKLIVFSPEHPARNAMGSICKFSSPRIHFRQTYAAFKEAVTQTSDASLKSAEVDSFKRFASAKE